MSHYILKCVCGNVLEQCRCADANKTVTVSPNPCTCATPMQASVPDPAPVQVPESAPVRDPKRYTTTDGKPPDPELAGYDSPAPKPIDPKTGQYGAYWALSVAERAKGFVRPLRNSYQHVGARPKHPTRDLTAEEQQRYALAGYVKFEEYPEPQAGRFWTERELMSGCGNQTKMGTVLAETYAREPKFYSGTFCAYCGKHFPVEEFVWVSEDGRVTSEVLGS